MLSAFEGFPGGELVSKGLADLTAGIESPEALLVSIGFPKLTMLGLEVPRPLLDAEHRLYTRLASDGADAAHGRYNALVRQLVSFERALACVD